MTIFMFFRYIRFIGTSFLKDQLSVFGSLWKLSIYFFFLRNELKQSSQGNIDQKQK